MASDFYNARVQFTNRTDVILITRVETPEMGHLISIICVY